jgi:hypothetical protein
MNTRSVYDLGSIPSAATNNAAEAVNAMNGCTSTVFYTVDE